MNNASKAKLADFQRLYLVHILNDVVIPNEIFLME